MMKNNKITTLFPLLLISFLLLGSCGKDFTALSPISDRNATNFYKDATDFNVAVMGAYDALQQNGVFRQAIPVAFEMQSDNAYNGAGASGISEKYEQVDRFEQLATGDFPLLVWQDHYAGIYRCNNIINRINGVDFDADLKNQYLGEALFIRSLLYYNLAVLFDNVPLVLDPATSVERSLGQESAAAVYSQIEGDLSQAADLLPPGYSAEDVGRATKWAAKALLAKVYLTDNKKADAVAPLNDIINSGTFQLLPFTDIFGSNHKNSKESIFEVQYMAGGRGEGSMYTNMFQNPKGDQIGAGAGSIPISVTTSIRDAFEPGDKRFPVSIVDTSSVQSRWVVPKYDGNVTSNLDGDANWIVLRYADVLLMMAEADPANGYTYINQVRDVHGGLGPISASGTETYEEQLLQERRVEFAFEGQRWPDLLRFGMAKQVMSSWLTIRYGTTFTPDDIKLVFPVPQQELDNSDDLNQNPEYLH